MKRIWDAATSVQGTQNNDADTDAGYTMEFKINLRERGYNVTGPNGDIVMYSLSIYDSDYRWPIDSSKFAGNRAWLQCPWGNASFFSHMRVFVRSDITTGTATLPDIAPDVRVPNGENFTTPTIDGSLTDQVWQYTPSFKINTAVPLKVE